MCWFYKAINEFINSLSNQGFMPCFFHFENKGIPIEKCSQIVLFCENHYKYLNYWDSKLLLLQMFTNRYYNYQGSFPQRFQVLKISDYYA